MNPSTNRFFYKMAILAVFTGLYIALFAYPFDGYHRTGIDRLLRIERIMDSTINEKLNLPPGALLPLDSVRLCMYQTAPPDYPKIDPSLQKQINRIFPNLDESYSITVLDFTNPDSIRYADKQANRGFQPGSVGKLAVVTAMFCELEDMYPESMTKRLELLKNKRVKAGYWAIPNIHTVPFFNPETNKLTKRLLIESDEFSLYEWLDHMLSVSSNGAASVVWREVLLMRAFGMEYPELTYEEGEAFFKRTEKKVLSDLAVYVVNEPLRELGIEADEWRLGTFFTRGASNKIPPQGGSIGTPKGLTKWLWLLEHGQVIDSISSLEIKRLLYMTDRRIRYAANKKLDNAAVFFKSGSLYKCKEEPGFDCGKYKGNVYNYMNSVAIVEHPDDTKYMVVLMSNVLRKNSNVDHNALAGRIDGIIRE